MSLINQIFKDLEARFQKTRDDLLALSGLESAAPEAKVKRQRLLLLGLLALIAVWSWDIGHDYYQQQKATLAVNEPLQNPVELVHIQGDSKIVPLHDTANPNPQTNPELAALTHISLQTQGKITHLNFILSKEVVYKLSAERNQNKMVLSLQGVKLSTNPPLLDYINSAVKAVSVSSDKPDSLNIILQLNPGVSVAKFELQKDAEGKNPELHLDLEMKNRAAEAAMNESSNNQRPG